MFKLVSISIKTNLLLFIILSGCFLHSAAQISTDASYKRFGFMAGINLSNMNFNRGFPRPSAPLASAWKSGIMISFLVKVPLAKNLFLQPQYSYIQRRGADKSLETSYVVDYFSLPALLSYKISPHFSLLAGPQAEILIHAKATNNGITNTITHNVEERSIGALAGIEFRLSQNFFLTAHYMKGLNHIGIGQRQDVKEFQYDGVDLMAGIEF